MTPKAIQPQSGISCIISPTGNFLQWPARSAIEGLKKKFITVVQMITAGTKEISRSGNS